VLSHELADGQKLEAGFSAVRRQTRLQESSIWNDSAGTLSSTPVPVADPHRGLGAPRVAADRLAVDPAPPERQRRLRAADVGALLNNGLSGYARGVDLMVQRESANGFSGWLSVRRSLNRCTPGDGSAAYWIDNVILGQGYKLTLKAEIANLLGHQNWRYFDTAYPAPGTAQSALMTRNTTMPRLPTVGMSLES
jgi:hypothetical protein